MKRYLCWLAVLGVCVLPDWASARHRRCWAPPPPCHPYPRAYPRQIVFVPPAVPVYEVPLPPPRVYVSPVTIDPVVPAPRPAAPNKFDRAVATPPAPEPLGTPRPYATPTAAPAVVAEPTRA